MAELRWGYATDPGRIRDNNEDNLLVESRLFVVADGMGGHNAGEIASELAVNALKARLIDTGIGLDDVVGAVADANTQIFDAANTNDEQRGMGTTVTALVVIEKPRDDATKPVPTVDDTTKPVAAVPLAAPTPDPTTPAPTDATGTADTIATTDTTDSVNAGTTDAGPPAELFALANVGDSRAYLYRHGRLRRMTVDHSYVQELVATGNITDDEARTHPRRNIVTRALGVDPTVRVDAWTLPIVRGDRIVLCSDGLVDEVRDDDIKTLLERTDDSQRAAEGLVDLANQAGGRDNITVIVVDVVEGADPPHPDSELDLEPAWADPGPTATTWAIDAPDDEATEFEDLANLVSRTGRTSGQPVTSGAAVTAAAAGSVTRRTDEVPVTSGPLASATPKGQRGGGPAPRRKRRVAAFIASVLFFAILIMGFVIVAAWGRHGYFVAFNDNGDVALYQGRRDGFLWFDPTQEAVSEFTDANLDNPSIERVNSRPEFGSRSSAERFIREQLDETTTTSSTTTTTSTTSTTTTTTTPPTTTVRPTSTG